jgi:metal-responsive CopG/Arc/MetJ family transcriptional regulator
MRSVLSVSLPKKIASELEVYAKDTGRNKSDIVRESIALYLWETRFKKARRQLRNKAKSASFVTEEDVFKAVS